MIRTVSVEVKGRSIDLPGLVEDLKEMLRGYGLVCLGYEVDGERRTMEFQGKEAR